MSASLSQTTAGPHPGYPPYTWYTSAQLLDRECRQVFDHSWALVATEDDLPLPGCYLTVTVGSSPLVVLRDADGELRAFHNLCRHRGLPVADGAGTCGRYLTCPYHQWSYDLHGALRRIPQADTQFAEVQPEAWALHPAAAAAWHGMVFANPDPDAPSLPASLGFLTTRLDPVLAEPLTEVAKVSYTAQCNWKLLVENHIDVYHLWYVHSRSLGTYDHTEFHWQLDSANWWSYEPLGTTEDGSSPQQRQGIGAHLLFPNLMIVTTGSYFATYDAVPLTPDTTVLTLRVRCEPGGDGPALVEAVRSFLAEDLAICEQLQRATGSSRFSMGPLALTHEAPIRAFHAALAARCHA